MIEKLRKEKELLEITLESIGDAVIATDHDARIIKMNHVAEELTAWSRQDAMGKPLDEVFQTVDGTTSLVIENPFRQSLEQGLIMGLKKDTLLRARDGSRSYVSASSSPIRNKQNGIVGIVVVFRDISRISQVEASLKEAKEEAESANHAKDEFLAKMSHEIRTPLNGIIGMTTLTLMSELNTDQKENLNIIKMCGDALLNIINDILDVSKIEAGKMIMAETNFNLIELIKKNISLYTVLAQEKGLKLRCQIDESIPITLTGDPYRIAQVLNNIIGNALKFTDNGEIVVDVDIHSKWDAELLLRIAVTDTGMGIALEQIANLFESFSQGDGSITRNYGGTGLGLYISKQLVNMMGGQIWVNSIPKQGSTFFFTLRLGIPTNDIQAIEKQAIPREYSCIKKSNKSLSILLVEDNQINQVVIANMLNIKGHIIEIANNGLEALQLLERNSYDLILMDIWMPTMDGVETTAQIRQREEKTGKHIPIIAITAHAIHGDREKFLSAGMDEYVSKPIQMDRLYDAVEKAMLKRGQNAKENLALEYLQPKGLITMVDVEIIDLLEEYIKCLDLAITFSNTSKIESYAHRIKELAYEGDEVKIKNLAFKIELAARKGDLDQVPELLNRMQERFRQLKNR
jgi:hypothetical protein